MLARMLVFALLAAVAGSAQDAIYFERVFPGAVPGEFAVKLTSEGMVSYSEEGDKAVEFEVERWEASPVFEWAASLDYFAKPLASKRKVASTGSKVVRYESSGKIRGEATFDYSEIAEARKVVSWFVRLAETQQHLGALERLYRFDRLGVNQALVSLEAAYERGRIVAPALLEPILNKIVQQQRIVHVARARAEGILERIRSRAQ